MKLNVARTSDLAKIPSYAHSGDAGMDLFSIEKYSLMPSENYAYSTGIMLEIPDGYVGLIMEKSGLALKNKIMVMGGVIDAGYRGEIKVIVYNASSELYVFNIGDKLAQLIIQKIERPEMVELEKLSDTDRAKKGFGSTGK